MKKIFLIFIVIAAFTSCKKSFLNPEQVNLVYNEIFWSNENDAEKAVLGVYSLYRAVMIRGEMYERADATTGFFNRGWNGGSPRELWQLVNVNTRQLAWGNLDSYADWGNYYKIIAMANLTISRIEKMNESLFKSSSKNKLLGETYFLRALTYYHIATIWGNAPLILEPIESSTQVIDENNLLVNKARVTDIEIMDAVIADVAKAVELLQFGRSGSDDWGIIANKGSAEALSGYANLWMAFLKKRDGKPDGENLTNAVRDLQDLVNNGGYSLSSYGTADNISNMYKGRSSEAVFEINVSATRAKHTGLTMEAFNI